jgi:predicted dehydrogenase
VAVLGCRGRGLAAARAYFSHPRCELVGLCDLLPQRMDELGRAFGVPPERRFSDADAMMRAQLELDLVAIPVGTSAHHAMCMKVLGYGVNVEVEKPMCANLEQADEVLATAHRQGARTAVHHQGLCGAPMRAVRKALADGRIGKIRHMISSDKGYHGGYGIPNIGTHIVNNLIGLAGPVRRVSASSLTAGRPSTPADVVHAPDGTASSGTVVMGDHITATAEFDGGVTATMLFQRFPTVRRTDAKAICARPCTFSTYGESLRKYTVWCFIDFNVCRYRRSTTTPTPSRSSGPRAGSFGRPTGSRPPGTSPPPTLSPTASTINGRRCRTTGWRATSTRATRTTRSRTTPTPQSGSRPLLAIRTPRNHSRAQEIFAIVNPYGDISRNFLK